MTLEVMVRAPHSALAPRTLFHITISQVRKGSQASTDVMSYLATPIHALEKAKEVLNDQVKGKTTANQ